MKLVLLALTLSVALGNAANTRGSRSLASGDDKHPWRGKGTPVYDMGACGASHGPQNLKDEIVKVGEVCGCIQRVQQSDSIKTFFMSKIYGCIAYHCAVIFSTKKYNYYVEMIGASESGKEELGEFRCVRAKGEFLFISTEANAKVLMEANSVMSSRMMEINEYEFHRSATDAVKEFKKDYQPVDVNGQLDAKFLGAPLTPAKVAGWIKKYGEIYPEYEGLDHNCQRFSSYLYEALSDAHFWGRKQKASSATAAFFIGPGHSEASTGAIATSARIVGNIKAGDVIPGSVATSTAESTAASVAASKALVTMGIKGSLAVANQFEKRKFSGAQGMMNMAKNIALNAEKFQLLTDKIIRNTDGSIQFPEWDVKKVRRSRATPKTPDNSYSVGSCTRFSSLGCWYNQPKESYKCLQDPSDNNKHKCYCKYWKPDLERFAKNPITDQCAQWGADLERHMATLDAMEFECHKQYSPESPAAFRVCQMGDSLTKLLDSRMGKEGDVNTQAVVQTAALTVGVVGGIGSSLTIAAAMGLSVSPLGVAVAPALAIAGLAILLSDHHIQAVLQKITVDVKTFIMKVKVLLHGFDVALEVTEDQEAHASNLYKYAVDGGAACTAVVTLLEATAANKAIQSARITDEASPDNKKLALKARETFSDEMTKMGETTATSQFKEWLKTPSAKMCMQSVMTSRLGSYDWMELKFTGATPKTDISFCGYVKLQRYSRDLDSELHTALNGNTAIANQIGAAYEKRLSAEAERKKTGLMSDMITTKTTRTPPQPKDALANGFMQDFGRLLTKIEVHWPKGAEVGWKKEAEDSMRKVLGGLKKLNEAVAVANVFLGVTAGVASIAGADHIARNTARLAHNAAETGNMIQGTNVAVTGHVAVTETTKLATAPELARHGITAAEQAAGATVNNIVVVADAVMDTKDTFDLAVGIAEAANILSIAAKRAEALGFAAGVAIAAGVV